MPSDVPRGARACLDHVPCTLYTVYEAERNLSFAWLFRFVTFERVLLIIYFS